jgi:hypothetical protein
MTLNKTHLRTGHQQIEHALKGAKAVGHPDQMGVQPNGQHPWVLE